MYDTKIHSDFGAPRAVQEISRMFGALFQVLGNGLELRIDYSRLGPQWALVQGETVTWFWSETEARAAATQNRRTSHATLTEHPLENPRRLSRTPDRGGHP